MLSVIIPTFNSSTHLQELLPVLVPAAVDGLVREVMAADEGSTDPTLMICDDAGVEVVTDGIAQAMKRARQDWILLLPPDIRLKFIPQPAQLCQLVWRKQAKDAIRSTLLPFFFGLGAQAFVESTMMIPVGVIELHEAHTAFDEATR